MTGQSPVLLWLRRDLRLADHPALAAACASGRPVIPVILYDDTVAALGAAPRFRLGLSIADLSARLDQRGSRLILRRGPAHEVLRALIAETGAGAVYWSRLYDPASRARDTEIKASLRADGIEAHSFDGALLADPMQVTTGQGGPYKVFTPFWKTLRQRDIPLPLAAPARIPAPDRWPASDALDDWRMAAPMQRGAAVVAPYLRVGEDAAEARLQTFLDQRLGAYHDGRDFMDREATSGLSENLTYGEISPRRIWHAAYRRMQQADPGAESFLRELAWRDFAVHLLFHFPDLATRNWRDGWDSFGWNTDASRPEVIAWQHGRTGVALVDAAMRQMYVTGTMHNRARMIAASYLTKHLLTDWRIGLAWFESCLIDWDPASNAMGWQWVAGCGPDAAPYFRIFNPDTQAQKFDPKGAYRDRWLAQGRASPSPQALSYYDAVPRRWRLSALDPVPAPVVDLKQGRERALAAYAALKGRD